MLVRNHEVNDPGAAFGDRRPRLRPDGPGRHDDDRGHALRRGRPVVHEPQRDADELLRRNDAVGRLDHLRGDRQRPGRRPGLHRRLEHPADQAARLHLRGPGRRPVRSPADHQGRSLRPRVGAFDPGREPLPDRGQLRLPVRVLPLHPGDRSDGDRSPRQRRAAPDAHGRRARRTPTSRRRRTSARRYQVEWVDIDDPAPSFPYTPGQPAPTRNDDAISVRRRPGSRPGRRAASPGSRARSTTTESSTSPRPRAAAPAETGPTRSRGYGNGSGQIWAYRHPRSRSSSSSTSRRARRPSTSRTTSRPARAARSSSARTTPTTTTCAACPAAASCGTSPSTGWSASIGASCRGSTTSSPGRRSARTATRCSSTSRPARGMTFAIWGPWERIGV